MDVWRWAQKYCRSLICRFFKVTGISSSGLEPTVTITGTELESETPSIGTETGGSTGAVAVNVQGHGWAEGTMAGLDKLAERRSTTSEADPSSATPNCWIATDWPFF